MNQLFGQFLVMINADLSYEMLLGVTIFYKMLSGSSIQTCTTIKQTPKDIFIHMAATKHFH